MRVLLIEDDSATAHVIELMLKSEGIHVTTTDLGEDGVDLAKLYDYDAILLDLNLPDMNGADVLRQIRAAKIETPVIVESGSSAVETKVKMFALGADDYVVKPFHKDEMVARIQAVVRRSKGHAQSTIATGPMVVNLDQKTVEVNGKRLHLTGKEYQMIELLSLRKGLTLSKEAFMNHLYGDMDEPELKIVDVFICKLRKKLIAAGAGHHIDTVWGRGYVLRDEPVDKASAYQPCPNNYNGPALKRLPGRVMVALVLGDGPMRPEQIANAIKVPYGTIFSPLRWLMERKYATHRAVRLQRDGRGGAHRAAFYEATPEGAAWLAKEGWARPADAA